MYTSKSISGNFRFLSNLRLAYTENEKNYAKHKDVYIRTHFREFWLFLNLRLANTWNVKIYAERKNVHIKIHFREYFFQICVTCTWSEEIYAKHKNVHIRNHSREFGIFQICVWRIRKTKKITQNIKMYTSEPISGNFALGIGGECHM